jgi:putative membrane protein
VRYNMPARTFIAVLAIPAGLACASAHHSQTVSSAGSVSLTDTPRNAVLSSRETEMLRSMTDPNILGHMAMADSVEIVMGKLALNRSKTDAVDDFARQMISDHTASLDAEHAIARHDGMGMQTMVGELNVSHMGPMVDSVGPTISEATFDRNYLLSQVQMHRHILAELQTLQDVARDRAVREHVVAAIPVVTQHMNRAHDLAVQRGYLKKGDWMH